MQTRGYLALVVPLILTSVAYAFEVDGFRSGMPIEGALFLAKQKGYTYKEPAPGFDNMVYGSTNGGPGLGYAEGKLCSVGRFGTGDVHKFVELLNQRMSRFGAATYTVHEEVMGNGNKFSQLAAKWRKGNDYTHVIIDKIGSAQETISDQYRDFGICPEKTKDGG